MAEAAARSLRRRDGARRPAGLARGWKVRDTGASTPNYCLVEKLRTALGLEIPALAQPDVKKRLLELNLNAQGSTPAQLGEHLAADVRRWSDVIAKAKIARQ
mgnify:CR=1 FL=1